MYDAFDVTNSHTFGCLECVLDYRLQNGQKIPCWEPRFKLDVFESASSLYADNVSLVRNIFISLVSIKCHLIFDDGFNTLSSLRNGTNPSNRETLYNQNSHSAERQDTTIDLSHKFPNELLDAEVTLENEG